MTIYASCAQQNPCKLEQSDPGAEHSLCPSARYANLNTSQLRRIQNFPAISV